MNFTDEMKRLGEDIVNSYDIRVSSVGDIIKDTRSTLKNFHSERMHMSEEQRSELDHFKKELMNMTKKMLSAFDKEHREMAAELRNDLSKFHRRIHNDTQKYLREFRTEFEKMAEEMRKMLSGYYKGEIQKPVHDMLSKYHNQMKVLAGEFQKGHEAWMSISRSMNAKKGIKPAQKKKMSKADQICSCLEGHPKGMIKSAIAKSMGCSPKSLTSPLSTLKKQGRIGKKQNKYFFK